MSPLWAWGFEGHRLINRQACRMLPEEMKGFKSYAEFLADHASDPDFLKQIYGEQEGPNHYLDIDTFDAYPFDNVPHDKGEMVAKFGEEKVRKNGRLPWVIGDLTGKLTEKMKTAGQPGRGSRWMEAAWIAATLGHYVADGHQPLHATQNYNGQLTGNDGIHLRYEIGMVNRHLKAMKPPKDRVEVVADPVGFAFGFITQAWTGVEPILKADDAAKAVSPKYEEAYYRVLWERTGELTRRHIAAAARDLSSLWYTAWVNAGRPPIPPMEQVMKEQ